MSYHKSVQGVGWVSLVPSGTFPDPIHLAEIESLDLNITEEDGDLQDASGDIIDSFTTKRVIEGTIALKDISGSLLAAVTRGVTVSAGTKQGYAQTTVIPTTPFEITVTQGATFASDLGVIDLTTGKAMVCDTTSTGTNVYAVNTATGKYTFNTADSGHSVLINYRATQASVGTTSIIASATTAQAYYGLHCYQVIAGKPWGIYIPAARLPGIGAKFGKAGWSDTSLKFKATKDSSGNFVHIYLPE